MREQTLAASDNIFLTVATPEGELTLLYRGLSPAADAITLFVALGTHREIGAAVLPFERNHEGSTVFLPFKSDLLFSASVENGVAVCSVRKWERWRWSNRTSPADCEVSFVLGELTLRIPRASLGRSPNIDLAVYAKDRKANDGWGWFFGCSDRSATQGIGDKYIRHYYELGFASPQDVATARGRYRSGESRLLIYQLFVRLFGNTNESRKPNGAIAENGVGKFHQINDAALSALRAMGFTHLWLMGVLQQATGTDYSEVGQPADDPDLLKGIAGSPYAIKDYFDVCPDYAEEPENRLAEFKALIGRIHQHKLKALIDFVPNHVARSYHSDVRPEADFGADDDRSKFFHPRNNFFYLPPNEEGPPLRLPTWKDGRALSPTCMLEGMKCDGLFAGETDHGKVTGNNAVSWTPALNDWYETIKLNYGFDFTDPDQRVREYPNAITPDKPAPDTWQKMDGVLEYWQAMGVDGFRCDMAHMAPPEFWNWLIDRARKRQLEVVFIGEAYDNDPAKLPGSDPFITRLSAEKGNVKFDLLNAGFNAVYDDPTYRALKNIYDGPGWANDIDDALGDPFIFENSLRYAENHDEVRLAAPSEWGAIGMKAGQAASAILYGLSRGPLLLHNGQEVGEPGTGAEGFGGEDARTSIFDYWSMPELAKWVNGHSYDGGRLSTEQKELRDFYRRLINLVAEPAFRDGDFFPLNPANRDNDRYGRLPNEQPSGHWLYGFLRYAVEPGQRYLVLANLHPTITLEALRVLLPPEALAFLRLHATNPEAELRCVDRLSAVSSRPQILKLRHLMETGVPISGIPPLKACYFELSPD